MLEVPKVKAPNTFGYLNEYIYNDGYYFANCSYPTMLNSNCYYLKNGCTGCLSDNALKLKEHLKNAVNKLKDRGSKNDLR